MGRGYFHPGLLAWSCAGTIRGPNVNPHLARIRIFPLKSLDGVDLDEVVVQRRSGLAGDREFCLVDENGDYVNTKRLGESLVRIRSEFDLVFGEITLRAGEDTATFSLEREGHGIEEWFGKQLETPVRLKRDREMGFPDDTAASGPTVISTATLREVASWFPGCDVNGARQRFRANLEVDGVPAFWEDRLFGPAGTKFPFRIGDVTIEGINPCARCTVPSRNPVTGEIQDSAFAKTFAQRRQEALPPWADKSRFDHFYRLAVNTIIPESEAGKVIRVYDEVVVPVTET